MSTPTPSERLRELEKTKYEAICELTKLRAKFQTIKNQSDEEYVNLMDSLVAPYVGKYYKFKHKMAYGELAFKIIGTPLSSWTKMEGREYHDDKIPVLMLKLTDRYRGDDVVQRNGLDLVPDALTIYLTSREQERLSKKEFREYIELSAFDKFRLYLERECEEISQDDLLEIIKTESIGLLDRDFKPMDTPKEEGCVDVLEETALMAGIHGELMGGDQT